MAANGLPKILKSGDSVLVKIASGHSAYFKLGREFRDTWLRGKLETNLGFPHANSVWVKVEGIKGLFLAGPNSYSNGEITIIRDVKAYYNEQQESKKVRKRLAYAAKTAELAEKKGRARLAQALDKRKFI